MTGVALLSAVLASLVQGGTQGFARVQVLALDSGWRADDAALADLDGDGTPEVLLALHDPAHAFARSLETWRTGLRGELERVERLALTRDVVAFAHADVLPGGGEELLLFNAGGAFAWRPGPEARPERLVAAELLWQAAEPDDVFAWTQGVTDLDGDGLADLVLPEPGGFVVALQRRPREAGAPWGVVSRLAVPREPDDPGLWKGRERGRGAETQRDNGSFTLSLRTADETQRGGGTLVSVEERVPAPAWLDWDADGDRDLLLQGKRALHVWLQGADGRFAGAPEHSLALPVAADDERELDASYRAHALDLDHDRRADCAILASDKRSDDVRVQALFFTQAAATGGAPLFGAEGKPASLLVFAGFVVESEFRDLDGDGPPELVVRTIRPDLIDQLRSISSESIDSELFVYRNHRGTLARQPELARRFAVPLDDGELQLEFLGDLTGDGLAELLVRETPEKLRLLMLRAARDGAWSLLEKPLWELNVAAKARLEVVRVPGARPSIFVLEPTQVLWARFP